MNFESGCAKTHQSSSRVHPQEVARFSACISLSVTALLPYEKVTPVRLAFSISAACFTVAIVALTTILALPAQAVTETGSQHVHSMSDNHSTTTQPASTTSRVARDEHNSVPAILGFVAVAAGVGFLSSRRETDLAN